MRLQDGINGYLRFLREEQADSAWRGQNFVFDRRTLVEPPAGEDTMDFAECVEFLETSRLAIVDRLARKYRSIGPLLGKIEEAVGGTNTGTSPQLASYYAHWEAKAFHAVCDLTLNTLEAARALTSRRDVQAWRFESDRGPTTEVSPTNPPPSPLFLIRVFLNAPDVVIQPSLRDQAKHLSALSGNVVACASRFTRWTHGTCVEAPTQLVGDDEPFAFTFHPDVAKCPDVVEAARALDAVCDAVVLGVSREVEKWDAHADVWRDDKEAAVARFCGEPGSDALVSVGGPTCEAFEKTFARFAKP